ncbi:MAG: hypothetical protein A2286_13300 [Gammaproteobacteria bacterium RIFOXYA12_FULL_61_12]|nr:MAG: hypothetical protein A2514_12470 [Gammaproteobacteria bacterium RIFOXYD12_FULL_61_37]OGT93921.1 MAG: hypothetical protein A2286_13300 [Gammaproteobacteria bacterium RIFOXYA12_FULL_61_12]
MTQPDADMLAMATIETPTFPPDKPIIIDGCGHKHYRQEFRFEGKGFFGRIHAAILNWLRRNGA